MGERTKGERERRFAFRAESFRSRNLFAPILGPLRMYTPIPYIDFYNVQPRRKIGERM